MPCDNSEYDGSDYGQAASLETHHRANDSPIRHTTDKGKLACLLTRTVVDVKTETNNHPVVSDTRASHEHLARKNSITAKNNTLLALNTHSNDEGQMSCKDNHQRQPDLSLPTHCHQGRALISMNDLSADLPKAAVSPEVQSKNHLPHFLTSNIPQVTQQSSKKEGLYVITDMKKDFHFNPHNNNKALSQTAHPAKLHYNSMEARFDPLQDRSKTSFDGHSLLTLPGLNRSWPLDVIMKSSPELSSYFSQGSPPSYRGSTSLMPFDLSQGKCTEPGSPHSSNATVSKVELVRSGERLMFPSTNEMTREITDRSSSLSPGFMIKREDASLPQLSPGVLSQHNPSSPYRSSSLSPWSPTGDSLGTSIKDKVKCASDSSLYLPTVVQASLSPASSSSIITKEEAIIMECRWKMCSQMFSSQHALAQHVNDCHVRIERPDVDFQCHWQGCPRQGKGFNARYKMLIHIRTHTNEKPHKCAVCRKCFSRLENLKIHMRSHTGEKPYACTFPGCSKAYSNSSDRFKHVRTHQEEKPYKCKMAGCHKQYTDPSSLRKHVRTHGHGTPSILTPSVSTPLQRSVSRGDGLQINDKEFHGQDKNSCNFRCHSVDMHADFNKGIEMDADRQRRQDLDNGQQDMTDIQRNIELYSSLEVKSGIQKFSQVEDCVREDIQSPLLAHMSQKVPKMKDNQSCHSHGDEVFDESLSLHSRPHLIPVPNIVIEDAEDSSRFEQRNINSPLCDKEIHPSAMKRKRMDCEELHHYPNALTVSDGQEEVKDVRKVFKEKHVEEDRGEIHLPPGDKVDSPRLHIKTDPVIPSSPPSHPKHWKKRKILDEEKLQQKQQEEEEERSQRFQKALIDERSRLQVSHHSLYERAEDLRQSPDNSLPTHCAKSLDTHSLKSLSMGTSGSLEAMAQSSPLGPHTARLLLSGSHYPPSTFPASFYPSSPVCCSSLSPYPSSHPSAFLTPSFFTHPELHPAHHPNFDQPFASRTTAVFFPKDTKTCGQIYFPYLSALMDLSSNLDPMSQHHHHLSPMSMTSHPRAMDLSTHMICPMVCPSVSRTLP